MPFGFSALESDVYARLLDEPEATGYRVAQGLRKPAANVYKALQTLAAKGAVTLEDGAEPLRARPVPPAELLAALEKRSREQLSAARKALARRSVPPAGAALYRIESEELIRAKALAMVEEDGAAIVGSAPGEFRDELLKSATGEPRITDGPVLLVGSREALLESGMGAFLTAHPDLVATFREAALLRLVGEAIDEGAGGKKIARIVRGDES